MFSFRNPVQEVKKTPKDTYVLTLTKMEGDADHYYYESMNFKSLEASSDELKEIILILKALKTGRCDDIGKLKHEEIGVSKETLERISDMVGYEEWGGRHKITEAVMAYYDENRVKFKGDFYLEEEKIFPMTVQ